MKRNLKVICLACCFIIVHSCFNLSLAQYSDPSPPPSSGPKGGHELGGNQGGDAPLEGGVEMILMSTVVYIGFLLYRRRKPE
jgi:hypothetical protein